MSLFFETIKIENGHICNLKYHNLRLNQTISELFNTESNINLSKHIKIANKKTYRCKVIYSNTIQSITLSLYQPRVFQSFKIVNTDINYPYKSVKRTEIDKLFAQKGLSDDIVMVKEDLVCDTSIANIAIYDGFKWYTPKKPILLGTQRAKLLKEKIIVEKDIKIKDFKNITKFAIMNALVGFHQIKDVKFYF